jgi:ATP-dependent DNA helicase RecG
MPGARWRRLATGWLTAPLPAQSAGPGTRGRPGRDAIRLVWFNLPSYMRGHLPGGERVLACGRVSMTPGGGLEIVHPEIQVLAAAEPQPIRPVYRLPAIVGQRLFASLITQTLDQLGDAIHGALPDSLRESDPGAEMLPIHQALSFLHNPPADADLDALRLGATPAHRALAFDELFAFELALAIERKRAARRAGIALDGAGKLTGRLLAEAPFKLTAAQHHAIDEISADLATSSQMNRMLMGDVGSGKTIVAFWAALRAIECGHQAVMMAPTELLAEQHQRSFTRLCGRLGISSALLTGKVTGSARTQLLRGLASGAIAMAFGTQALIQETVRVRSLGLGIIDEQHRFGVFDRARLKALGPQANVLMMTATPIPRSLAMSLFANLDVSFLDEMPPGRTPIATEIFAEDALERVHEIVREELSAGRRAYYILPLIDGDETEDEEDLRSVIAMAERLGGGALKGFKVGLLHGRMRSAEKDRVMREFRDGALDALVSTTVVEVGIDVPEATVMVVIAAERYGLAQLHQLRGRVGRGEWASRCCLVASRGADAQALERLQIMTASRSGAAVAEADLRMRGPGDLLGARQAGALPLKFVHFVRDHQTIERARALAERWLARDPALDSPASAGARVELKRMLSLGFSLGDVA